MRLIRQNQNPMLYARAFVQGRYKVVRTSETTISRATPVAEGWFYDIQNRIRAGEQLHEPLFADVVRDFLTDPTVKASVSAGQHDNYGKKWSVQPTSPPS